MEVSCFGGCLARRTSGGHDRACVDASEHLYEVQSEQAGSSQASTRPRLFQT